MASITISITIPDKLESDLQKQADNIGISRSRYICNLLLEWQQKGNGEQYKSRTNDCLHQDKNWCKRFDWLCTASQSEAETCSEYKSN